MRESVERRTEQRLRYNWPVWFAGDFNDVLSQGQMVDISSHGAAFTCDADKCPHFGQHVTTRFSVPYYDSDDSFELANFIREGNICRIEEVSPFFRRVALQFAEPLTFKPGEKASEPTEAVDETAESDKTLEFIGM